MSRRWLVLAALAAALVVASLVLVLGRGGGAGARPSGAAAPPPTVPLDRRTAQAAAPSELATAPVGHHDDDPAGSERLEGLVLDAADRPAAGVTVVIDAHPAREATSDENGAFAFDALAPRTYRVQAREGARVAGPVAVRLTATSEPVVLRLREAGTITVRVLAARDERPVAGAIVELRDLAMLSEVSDAAGVATLRGVCGGWHVLHVSAAGHASAFREVAIADAAAAALEVTVRLQAGVSVSGVVVDAAGAPVEGARVRAESVSRSTEGGDPRLDAATTDAKGRWRLVGLPRETLRFHGQHPHHAPATTGLVALADGVDRDGVIVTLGTGAAIAGRVLDGRGAPVAGAEVRVLAGNPRSGVIRRAACDGDGRFRVTGLPRRPVHVSAAAERATSPVVPVDLSAVERAEVELRLSLDAEIAGVVVSPDGAPVGEARVVAEPVLADDPLERIEARLRGEATAIADADGHFRLTGLEPGGYLVRAIRPGASSSLIGMRPGVRIEAGARDARVEVDALARVRGRVAFASGGGAPARISVRLGMAAPRDFAAADFVLDEVPAGKHFLEIDGPELVAHTMVEVEVRAGADLDLGTIAVSRGRRLRGVVVDRDGRPVAGATVVVGSDLDADGCDLVPYPDPGVDQVLTGPDGRFVVEALGPTAHVLAADHATVGRATTVAVPAGTADVERRLVLEPPAVVQGFVRLDGEPVETVVQLRAADAADASFEVGSGPDGSYRFDRLAPGRYILLAGRGRGTRVSGSETTSRRVEVAAGQVLAADLDLTPRGVQVTLAITSPGDAVEFAYALIASVDAPLTSLPRTVSATRAVLTGLPSTEIREGMIVSGRQIVLGPIKPGPQLACATALRGDPSDPAVRAELTTGTARWPITCVNVTVSDRAGQRIVVPVEPR